MSADSNQRFSASTVIFVPTCLVFRQVHPALRTHETASRVGDCRADQGGGQRAGSNDGSNAWDHIGLLDDSHDRGGDTWLELIGRPQGGREGTLLHRVAERERGGTTEQARQPLHGIEGHSSLELMGLIMGPPPGDLQNVGQEVRSASWGRRNW
jgi:hypothetical protein